MRPTTQSTLLGSRPMKPLTLRTKRSLIQLELDPNTPVVLGYSAVGSPHRLEGGSAQRGFWVTLLDRREGAYRSSADGAVTLTTSVAAYGEAAAYLVTAFVDGAPVGELEVRFALEAGAVRASSTIVCEKEGYEFASVYVELLRVAADLPGAALVLPTRSGRLIELANAAPEEGTHFVSWFEPAPVGIAAHDGMVGVLTLDTVDSQFLHEVRTKPKEGSITVQLLHRHVAEKPVNSFLAQRTASCTVRLVAAPEGGRVDWTHGAALVRDATKPNLNDLYVGAVVVKVLLQAAYGEKVTTYDDVLQIVKRVHKLTGGARQVVYLVGWQHNGHDTGYPDVFTPNVRVGTFEDFQALKEAAKAYNAIVSTHDNYHDTYMESVAWDPDTVCIDFAGELRKGGQWGAGQAYEIGPTRYVKQAAERAERTVKMLALEKTTHLDVLSDKPDMVDFDPVHPANREQNAAAKCGFVESFRRCGVDVTSEVLTSPFASCIHHYWHVERRPIDGWGPFERVPLVPFIYHGRVTAGGNCRTDAELLDAVEYGWTFSDDWDKDTTEDLMLTQTYLVALPWSLLARRNIVGFRRDGDWETVSYGPDTYVRVNRAVNRYEVVVDGERMAADFSTFAPVAPGAWRVYSRHGCEVSLRANGRPAVATSLLDGSTTSLVAANGRLTFAAAAGTPYEVRENER